ncbi:unnamed protein product [Orchesella dallaii]|uniref:Progestin and adipoQ receptor family member 3 n=1 Tax=Orchesella dallaii TaxID=48710 RepID=A0ABP1PRS0_9HEXA
MDDSFPASTSKLCWFNLTSFVFKSAASASQESPQQSPVPSPIKRRTSPRLASSQTSATDTSSADGKGAQAQQNLSQAGLFKCCCEGVVKKSSNNTSSKGNKRRSVKDSDNDEEPCCKCTLTSSSSSSPSPAHDLNDQACCQGHLHSKHTTHGLSLKEAPHYLTFNPYITGGYRNNLAPVECIKSLFWWTNETLNIWSHLLGFGFFFSLTVYDILGLTNLPTTQPWDQTIFSLLLICFQACMILSAAYHVFCCCSEKSYRQWLTADLLGVSLSLVAIYISGIYFAFSCVPFWLNFYLSTVAGIFVTCLTCTFFRTSDGFSNRLFLFGGWACYGIVPTVHWAILHGGMSSPAVALLLPRIFWMYAISAAAFFFYVSKLPERWKPGLVNYIGSSHQIWHVLIVAALYHWHNTGVMYLNYRSQHPCSEEYAALYSTSDSTQTVS